jgi:hypothetical protein
METKSCDTCGATFERQPGVKANRWNGRRFCSRKCAAQVRRKPRIEKPCLTCGEPITGHPYRVSQQKYCSLRCQPRGGAANPNWKNGGRFKMPGGYIGMLIYPDHALYGMGAKRGTGQARHILEHRLVMAQHLGRPLTRNETVHHLNGDRQDNRIENLELWTGRHGRGVRHHEVERHCPTCTCRDQ